MRLINILLIPAFLLMGGSAYGQQPPHGCTSIPNQGICPSSTPSPSPSPSPTPDASATPTLIPAVEAVVGVQETRPLGESPVPAAPSGDEARGEVVRRTNNPSQPVHNSRDQLPRTGVAGVGTLLLIVLGVWGLGFLMRWWSEKRGYSG